MKCQNGSCRYRRYNTSNYLKSDFLNIVIVLYI